MTQEESDFKSEFRRKFLETLERQTYLYENGIIPSETYRSQVELMWGIGSGLLSELSDLMNDILEETAFSQNKELLDIRTLYLPSEIYGDKVIVMRRHHSSFRVRIYDAVNKEYKTRVSEYPTAQECLEAFQKLFRYYNGHSGAKEC